MDAFRTIVEACSPALLRTATAILGIDADARGATEEAFAAMWRALPGLRDPRAFDAWSAGLLVEACRIQLARAERLQVREVPTREDADPAAHLRGGRPSTRVREAVAPGDLLERAFDRLDPDDRALLVLHLLDRRPTREIATIMRIPDSLVRSRLNTARFALERSLDRARG